MTVSTNEANPAAGHEPHLHRSIGLWQMTLYGLGSMLGAQESVVYSSSCCRFDLACCLAYRQRFLSKGGAQKCLDNALVAAGYRIMRIGPEWSNPLN